MDRLGNLVRLVLLPGQCHDINSVDDLLVRFDPPLVTEQIDGADWWSDGWQARLPARRNEMHGRDAWPLNVQLAGPLDSVRARLLLEIRVEVREN